VRVADVCDSDPVKRLIALAAVFSLALPAWPEEPPPPPPDD